MTEKGDLPYPLDNWASRIQEIPAAISEAINVAIQSEGQPTHRTLKSGAAIKPLAGAGNHNVLGLHFEGRSYCLKQPTPGKRHQGNPEIVLRREVGGMYILIDRVPDICPRPISWSIDPAWLLMEMLPGSHLGNVNLTKPQLIELANAYKALYKITPETFTEPLWEIDWDIHSMLEGLKGALPKLIEISHQDEMAAEAASLIGDWLASQDLQCFLEPSDCIVFARGDQNMANMMWDGQRIRIVDFEYCGWNDMPRDLSMVTEHIRSYETPIESWDLFIDQFDLSRSQHRRLRAGRRRQALSWLAKACLKPATLQGAPEKNRTEVFLDRARQLCLN